MRTSDQIDKIAPALAAVYSEVGAVAKNAKNPHFKSNYADLAAIDAAIRPVLASHSLCVMQGAHRDQDEEGKLVFVTRAVHTSGQWVESYVPYILPDRGSGAQAHGSAQSYARRYGLLAFFALATADDDGYAASQPAPKPTKADYTAIQNRIKGAETVAEVAAISREFVGMAFPSSQMDNLKTLARSRKASLEAPAPADPVKGLVDKQAGLIAKVDDLASANAQRENVAALVSSEKISKSDGHGLLHKLDERAKELGIEGWGVAS